ncbi:MAG: carboxypeptidase regulatory-like domain-containing protein [Planctomycetota bacterium]|jgi:hypothetical protein
MGKWGIVALLLLFLFSCFFIWQVMQSKPDDAVLPIGDESASQEEDALVHALIDGVDPDMEEDPLDRKLAEKVPVPAQEPVVQEEKKPEPKFHITGRVVDKETDEPVTDFTVGLMSEDEKTEEGYRVRKFREEFKDEEGRFVVPVEKEGKYSLFVYAKGYLPPEDLSFEIPGDFTVREIVIHMEPALTISGIVLDDLTGLPIEEAEVSCAFSNANWRGKDGKIVRRTYYTSGKTKTDKKGEFSLTDLRAGVYVLTAAHPRYTHTTEDTAAGTQDVEIRMQRGFKIFGRVLDDDLVPVQGVEIRYKASESFKGGPYLTNYEGYYVTDPLRPCKLRIRAAVPEDHQGVPIRFTEEAFRVEVKDHDLEVNFGPSPNHVTWKGTFFGWDGRPVPRGQLRVWNDWTDNDLNDALVESGPSIYRNLTCDKAGRFEIKKLLPGTFRVDMNMPGKRILDYFGGRDQIEFRDPGIIELDLYLRRTELSGTIVHETTGKPVEPDWGHVSASRIGGSRDGSYYSTSINKDGTFRFRGLQPTSYSLQASLSKYPAVSYGRIELGENEIKDDIKIIIPSSGTVSIKVTEIQNIENTHIDMEILRTDGSRVWSVGPGRFTKEGSWEIDMPHKVGSWILRLSDDIMGTVERPYEIIPNEVTEINIRAEEFRKDVK